MYRDDLAADPGSGAPPPPDTGPTAGAALIWFTFPGKPYEVASVWEANGRLRGYYTNVVRPPDLSGSEAWHITDLFLDVWQPRGQEPEILDEEEFEEAREKNWIEPHEAARARSGALVILGRIRSRRWPPRVVRRWPLDAVPSLRFRRDEPGRYFANLVSTRVIAYGLYLLGAVSLTSVLFAAATDALITRGSSQTVWLVTLGIEAVLLLPFALAGRLPATEHARPSEAMNERTLLAAAAATGIAVLLLNRSEIWRELLVAVYASLAFFLTVFAVCRAWFDRTFPLAGIAGLLLCLIALVVLR
jgi:hypothetical protein